MSRMKKSVLLNIAVALLFIASPFLIATTGSNFVPGVYDWRADVNDDGVIDITDVAITSGKFGTFGEAVNKTAWYELQQRVDGLNETVQLLLTTISSLNSIVSDMQVDIDNMNSSINILNSTIGALCSFAVNSTTSFTAVFTTETMNWIDMGYTSTKVSLQRTSSIVILFCTQAAITLGHGTIMVRAVVNDTPNPSDVYLTPYISKEGTFPGHRHSLSTSSYSYCFYQPSVPPGDYTIKIQWRLYAVESPIQGSVSNRTLTVLAFPEV